MNGAHLEYVWAVNVEEVIATNDVVSECPWDVQEVHDSELF